MLFFNHGIEFQKVIPSWAERVPDRAQPQQKGGQRPKPTGRMVWQRKHLTVGELFESLTRSGFKPVKYHLVERHNGQVFRQVVVFVREDKVVTSEVNLTEERYADLREKLGSNVLWDDQLYRNQGEGEDGGNFIHMFGNPKWGPKRESDGQPTIGEDGEFHVLSPEVYREAAAEAALDDVTLLEKM